MPILRIYLSIIILKTVSNVVFNKYKEVKRRRKETDIYKNQFTVTAKILIVVILVSPSRIQFLGYHANHFNKFSIQLELELVQSETVRDVIALVSGDSILMSKQSMHAARLGAARAYPPLSTFSAFSVKETLDIALEIWEVFAS